MIAYRDNYVIRSKHQPYSSQQCARSPSLPVTRVHVGERHCTGTESCLQGVTSGLKPETKHYGQVRFLGPSETPVCRNLGPEGRAVPGVTNSNKRGPNAVSPATSSLGLSVSSLPFLTLLFSARPGRGPLRLSPARKGLLGSRPGWKGPGKEFNCPALGFSPGFRPSPAVYFHS